MGYIDAERLCAEIKRLKDEYTDIAIDSHYGTANANHVVDDLEQLLSLIDSLQQEQPAKRGYKDCNGCEYNRPIKDQIGWQFRGCFGGDYKGKPIAEIELCPLKGPAIYYSDFKPAKIRYDEPDAEEYIRKDLVEHIIRGALGPQDALNKIHLL